MWDFSQVGDAWVGENNPIAKHKNAISQNPIVKMFRNFAWKTYDIRVI